jgi:hypothetical protein
METNTLSDEIIFVKKRNEQLQRLVLKMEKHCNRLGDKLALKLLHQATETRFASWQDHTIEEKQMKNKALKVIQRLMNGALVSTFERWRGSHYTSDLDFHAIANVRAMELQGSRGETDEGQGLEGKTEDHEFHACADVRENVRFLCKQKKESQRTQSVIRRFRLRRTHRLLFSSLQNWRVKRQNIQRRQAQSAQRHIISERKLLRMKMAYLAAVMLSLRQAAHDCGKHRSGICKCVYRILDCRLLKHCRPGTRT